MCGIVGFIGEQEAAPILIAKKSTRTSWPLFITLLNVSIIIYLFP